MLIFFFPSFVLSALLFTFIKNIEGLGPNDYDPFPYSAPDDDYPRTALRCYSSMTSPDNILICPEYKIIIVLKKW